MVDPVGAPTFVQMFSPTKSPFYALALAALAALAVVHKLALAHFASGFMLTILVVALACAPFFRPTYNARSYGLSLMFGRTAGLIGAIIAMSLLVSLTPTSAPTSGAVDNYSMEAPADNASDSMGYGSDAATENATVDDSMVVETTNTTTSAESYGNYTYNSYSMRVPPSGSVPSVFHVQWGMIAIQALFFGLLMLFRVKPMKGEERKYNITQFCLTQSILLMFIIIIAAPERLDTASPGVILSIGLRGIFEAPAQLFTPLDLSPAEVSCALMVLWAISGVANATLLAGNIELGRTGDHGEGQAI